jgi:hypothetical protein
MGSHSAAYDRDFEPTVDDVYAVRRLLVEFVSAAITNIMLDEAHYWARVVFSFHPDEDGGEALNADSE